MAELVINVEFTVLWSGVGLKHVHSQSKNSKRHLKKHIFNFFGASQSLH